ncbi:MAG TPA: HIT domain-containing protein [Verrucomicrobiae bacterium]|jgi:ATP adenylyltransferase|nr:HIT domain-containing protein [Verrucomicrobiae bacterium]
MEPLHAPWRIAYIRGPRPAAGTAHLFKDIAESSDDVGNYVVARERSCYAVLNRYPYTGGHVLVIPYKVTPDLNGLTEDEVRDLFLLTRRCQNALTAIMRPDGFNIGINLGRVAGAGIIEHVHVHVVPRWNGDTNFMPVIGSTTVLPEALADVAAQLRAALAQQNT